MSLRVLTLLNRMVSKTEFGAQAPLSTMSKRAWMLHPSSDSVVSVEEPRSQPRGERPPLAILSDASVGR